MDFFDLLTLIGGLSLFLFGMNIMGQALERRAGNRLRSLLGKLTTNKAMGLLTGLAVTAVIQSSSATTVMVVGFVNSGLMTLGQAVGVIMGANLGTCVTSWILSLTGISGGDIFWLQLLKPDSFTPVFAFVAIIMLVAFKNNSKKQDTATIFMGFAILMYGMEFMSSAVSGNPAYSHSVRPHINRAYFFSVLNRSGSFSRAYARMYDESMLGRIRHKLFRIIGL